MKRKQSPAEILASLDPASLVAVETSYGCWRRTAEYYHGDNIDHWPDELRATAALMQGVLRAYDALCVAVVAAMEEWDGVAVYEEMTEQHKVFIQSPDHTRKLPWYWNPPKRRKQKRRA